MNSQSIRLVLALAIGQGAAHAQVVLSIDIDERNVAPQTQGGFSSFVITSNTSATAAQTTPTTRTFGDLTVTLAGLGNPAYDDRVRTTPTDGGALTQSAIYRDFVFQSSTTNGDGLSVTIDGLTAGEFYKATVWSYDNTSTGSRVSDWFANGSLVKAGYTFAGGAAGLPTTDSQYQFNFTAAASETGQLVVQGRRTAATSSAGGVFLNAMQLEIVPPEPAGIVVHPQPVTVYEGDHAILNAQASGTPPVSVQWYQGESMVEDATNFTMQVLFATTPSAGDYYMVASSPHGMNATSQVATLTVLPVANIRSGLLAHWSLDQFNDVTDEFVPDLTANVNHLAPASMNVGNTDSGRHATSMTFDGIDEYLTRTNDFASLPAYQYPAYTVALWVKGNGVGQADRRVWSESSNTNNTPLVDIGTVPGGTNGAVDIFIRPNSGGGLNHRTTSLIAFDGNWHHIAWVDNNGYGRVYVDGVADTNNFNYTRGTLIADATCLGGVARTNGGLSTTLFTGSIDDVHVWRRSLTEEEVRTVMDRVRILGINRVGADTVITYVTSTPADIHRVQEKPNIEDGWNDTVGVVIASTGPNTFTATFTTPGGGQKFYRVVTP